jgi:hypothetical protein
LGVNLFALAGAYATFDGERVSDKSAAQAKTALIMTTFSVVSPEKKKIFSDKTKLDTNDPSLHEALCADIEKIGAPNYYPKYMILHGIKAFTGNPYDGALVDNFDPTATWSKVKTVYLHCTTM